MSKLGSTLGREPNGNSQGTVWLSLKGGSSARLLRRLRRRAYFHPQRKEPQVSQQIQPLAEKVCKTCESSKPLSEFYLRKQGRKFVRRHTCRDCQIHKQRKKATGASEEDYQLLLVAQDFKCSICRSATNGSKSKFAVDHCHTTGAIRGLLCCSCNMALGLFGDDPLRLSRAITYLAESRNVGV